jgi:hypothetical protein
MPFQSMPYAPRTMYEPRYNDSIAMLMARQGEIAGQAQMQKAAIWGNAMSNIGQIGAQAYQQHAEQKQAKKRDQMFNAALEMFDPADPMPTYKRLASVGGPKPAMEFVSGLVRLEEMRKKAAEGAVPTLDEFKASVVSLGAGEKLNPGFIAKSYPTISPLFRAGAKQYGGIDLPDNPTPEQVQQFSQHVGALYEEWGKQGKPGTRQVETVNPDGSKSIQIVEDKPGQTFTSAPEKPKLGSFERQIMDKYPGGATPEQVEQERKKWADAGHVTVNMPGGDDVDPKAIAEGIINGTMPPTVNQYGRAVVGAVSSHLAKKGYNLASAQTDWSATQKHMATLNGSQQTRLRQAVETAYHSLDVIEDLAKQWQGGKFPMLNKGQLAAAKSGVLGPKAQAIATKLEAQISDVTSELGNVYMGGNSPTDHALQLAAKNLSADWSLPQLQAALDLSRTNLKIRANSMVNVGVAGASADNPYDQPAPAAAGFTVTAPNGKTYSFKSQAEADVFKKRAGIK